jgi:hypothetical protein
VRTKCDLWAGAYHEVQYALLGSFEDFDQATEGPVPDVDVVLGLLRRSCSVPDGHVDDEPIERTNERTTENDREQKMTRKQRTSDDEVSITREAALLPLYLVHRVLELAMLQRVDIVSVVPSDRQEEVNIPGIGPGGGAGPKGPWAYARRVRSAELRRKSFPLLLN